MPELRSVRQEQFAQEYARRMNAVEAAQISGHSRHYAHQLLRKPHVRNRIKELQAQGLRRVLVDRDRIMQEAAYVAFSDITDVLASATFDDLRALPVSVRKAIKKVRRIDKHDRDGRLTQTRLEIEMHDKQAAQRLLAQAVNMLREGGEGGDGEVQAPFTGVDIHLPGGETLRLGHRSTGNGAATPPETHQNGAPRDDQGNGRG